VLPRNVREVFPEASENITHALEARLHRALESNGATEWIRWGRRLVVGDWLIAIIQHFRQKKARLCPLVTCLLLKHPDDLCLAAACCFQLSLV
jgi:hypothetical protein